MSRKNIFEILNENYSMQREAERIDELFDSENLLVENYQKYNEEKYTLKDFVAYFCFCSWKNRGHCIDLQDFLNTVDYDDCCRRAQQGDVEAFFIFVEIVLNCWKMAETYEKTDVSIQCYTDFKFLYDIIVDCLSRYNHTVFYDKSAQQMLVIEDDSATTAVAEIVKPKLSIAVLKYNHHALRGDIDKKKDILLALGTELEPKRKILRGINSTLEDDIFFMLNNLNLRHNNMDSKDKNYREAVAKMDTKTLEKWYDELYQMILLAFLEIDQIDRTAKVKTLKATINGGIN